LYQLVYEKAEPREFQPLWARATTAWREVGPQTTVVQTLAVLEVVYRRKPAG
jgi:hypothetical protein